MQKVTLNQQTTFELRCEGEKVLISDQEFTGDILAIDSHNFHVIYDQHSYRVQWMSLDRAEKTLTFKIDGKTLQVSIKDRLDMLLDQMGMSQVATQKLNDLKAPMPGMIIDVLVEVGQSVEKGDKLLILEAMKMENIIKASGSGVVKNLKVQKGQGVEKSQVLIEFE